MGVGACAPETAPGPLDAAADVWQEGPELPEPIANQAVAAVEVAGRVAVFSFLGIDSTKVWSGVTNRAFRWDMGDDAWRVIDPVPGPGRLAPTTVVVDGLVYVIGGYTVAADGSESSTPHVNVYDPGSESWTRVADIPVPADDAISGVTNDGRIVLVSGWHDRGNVPDVQIYDPVTDVWSQSTPIPGPPVFGHSGTVVGDQVVYVDGVAVVNDDPRFQLAAGSWGGTIGPVGVEWGALPEHPGPALYRAAAGAVGNVALILGGSDNPYNYNGVGYDGVPAEPIRQLLAFLPGAGEWRNLVAPPVATMDHRTLGVAGGFVFLVGGMESGQRVSSRVWLAPIDRLLEGLH